MRSLWYQMVLGQGFIGRGDLFLNERGDLFPKSFLALRLVKSFAGNGGRSAVNTVAVREQGSKKYYNVLRFLYRVPSSMPENLESWIAVHRTEPVAHMLLCKKDDYGRLGTPPVTSTSDKDFIEGMILGDINVTMIAQRCSEWIGLRQFRITGTGAG